MPKVGRFFRIFRSVGVAFARAAGSAGAQVAHPCRSLCLPCPAGGAVPPLGALLNAAARPAPLPRRPLRPCREPGGRGPSHQPQLQPVFVASSRSPARPRLAGFGFARGWGGFPLRRLHAPAVAPASRRACTSPRRLQRAEARMHWPLLPLLGAPGVGGGEAGERRRQRQRQQRFGCRLGGLGARTAGPGGTGRTQEWPEERCTRR